LKSLLRKTPVLIISIIWIISLCSCAAPKQEVITSLSDSARVIVTRDFGREVIFEKTLLVEAGMSAMDALKRVAGVETAYGGGFVKAINGISSEYGGADSRKKDWFFYINGIVSNLGARDCVLRGGDFEHWDFRDWSYQQLVPAVISSYPQPFLSGFRSEKPTLVVYETLYREEAEALVSDLKQAGVARVSPLSDTELSGDAREQNNLIIVAGLQNSLISELNKLQKKLGFYWYAESGKVVVLDECGNPSSKHDRGCGLIQATQNPWNPDGIGAGESAVWMITGTDEKSIKDAANVLIRDRNELGYAFAVLISEGLIMKIP